MPKLWQILCYPLSKDEGWICLVLLLMQGYDGASAMSSGKNGVQVKV